VSAWRVKEGSQATGRLGLRPAFVVGGAFCRLVVKN
jgi:hypothetical protein